MSDVAAIDLPYRIGCPMWGNRHWNGTFFAEGTKVGDYLAAYSGVFNTVEGNTTFYGLPSAQTVERWAEECEPNFNFCFKFPQRISHALRLRGAGEETQRFFSTLAPLQKNLGPFMLQLPPDFSPESMRDLRVYLQNLPNDFQYAIEVRHLDFFQDESADDQLSDLLATLEMDRVIFDTRPLFSAKANSDAVRDAQKKKPRVPANTYQLASNPSLRFIGHPDSERSEEYFKPWLRKVANWIADGKTPYVFLHTPDNADAPDLARRFHIGLQGFLPKLPDLLPFPAQVQQSQDAVLEQRNAAVARADVDEHQFDLF